MFKGHPELTPDLINLARCIAKAHSHRMLKPHGRMSFHVWGLGGFRLVDAEAPQAIGISSLHVV
ncbi:hypothetical protein D9M72_626970 [compost metagenome]